MIAKPAGCDLCPLRDKGKGFVPDLIAKHGAKWALVGEAPGTHEVEEGEPFVGQAGYVLKEWLLKAVPSIKVAHERGQVTIMNTLRCLPPMIQGRPYPKGQEKLDAEACCRQYDAIGPEVHTLVLFGESPQRAFFGEELNAEDLADRKLGHDVRGTMGRVGRVIEREGKRYVFCVHPAYILRQPALVGHGQQALAIAANTERVLQVDYKGWDNALKELYALQGVEGLL